MAPRTRLVYARIMLNLPEVFNIPPYLACSAGLTGPPFVALGLFVRMGSCSLFAKGTLQVLVPLARATANTHCSHRPGPSVRRSRARSSQELVLVVRRTLSKKSPLLTPGHFPSVPYCCRAVRWAPLVLRTRHPVATASPRGNDTLLLPCGTALRRSPARCSHKGILQAAPPRAGATNIALLLGDN